MRMHHNGEGIAIATEKDLVVMVYSAVPLEKHFITLERVELDVLKAHPEGMSILNLISRPSRMFDMPAPVRERATGLGKKMAPRTHVIANIVEGPGFFAAIARSIIASVAMLGSHPFPQKVFSTQEEGIPWFAEHHSARSPHALTTDSLMAIVGDVRHEFGLAHAPAQQSL